MLQFTRRVVLILFGLFTVSLLHASESNGGRFVGLRNSSLERMRSITQEQPQITFLTGDDGRYLRESRYYPLLDNEWLTQDVRQQREQRECRDFTLFCVTMVSFPVVFFGVFVLSQLTQ